jgi:hypothetical protein
VKNPLYLLWLLRAPRLILYPSDRSGIETQIRYILTHYSYFVYIFQRIQATFRQIRATNRPSGNSDLFAERGICTVQSHRRHGDVTFSGLPGI